MANKIIKFVRDNVSSVVLILVGSISWSLTMVKSGWLYDFGMGFWGPNGHDGVWHMAVAESLARGSWNMPIFSSSVLQNYHIGFDLILAMLHKLTFVPISKLYFQVIPPILAVSIGVAVYKFVLQWTKSKAKAQWSTFFIYFAGSWGWVITLFRSNELGGESMFWSQQSISTLINPPFAMSLAVMFIGLILLDKGIKTKDKRLLTLTSFLFGILIMIKVYAGLLILGALFVTGIYQMIIKREGISILKVFTGSLILSLLLFLPTNSGAVSSLEWKPFWFLETMMQLSDRLGWMRFGDAMVNYKLGGIWWKAIPAYFIAFTIFWYGNTGSRLLSEVYFAKRIVNKKIDYLDILIGSVILAGIAMPLFFLQKGTPWNTIQFMYYSLFLSGLVAGLVVGEWFEKSERKKNKIGGKMYLLAGVIVLLTIPTTYSTLFQHYLPSRPPAKLSHDELDALSFLSKQPDGVVLTFPFDKAKANLAIDSPPRPLYLYESTAYVSAFSKKDVYLEDEVNLNITGYDWPTRRKMVESFLDTLDQEEARRFLSDNNISYIYWVKGQRAKLGEKQLGIEKVFENDEVDIYNYCSGC